MDTDLRLWCCPFFLDEVEAVAASTHDLAGLRVETYPIACLQGSRPGRFAPGKSPFSRREGAEAIIGGSCLQTWGCNKGGLDDSTVLAPQQCFHLIAPSALVEALTRDGAYILTPGWLGSWREILAAWGFPRQAAGEFFRECCQKLVLLDTGVNGHSLAELEAMGDYLGLERQAVPVGLDVLKLSLQGMVRGMRLHGKPLPPSDRHFADHLMVIDMMTEVLMAGGEDEALNRVEELFGLLFAPGRMLHLPAGQGPEAKDGGEDGFAWTPSGRGFLIQLRHREEDLGWLEMDDLRFAEYRERYLALALPLAKVCALALSNARALEARGKAEAALRAMAGIVASSDDAIIGKNLEGVIVSWNQGARRIYGYEEHEVLGRHVSFLTPRGHSDEMPRMLLAIKEGQPTEQVETVWLTKNGRLSDVSLQVSPIRDDRGQIVGASSIARDITKEKQKADLERRSLEAQLQQAQKLETVGRLAGGVAHDFNNMLAVILGYSELTLSDLPQDGELRQNLEAIHDAAERAKGLTRQLLAFARKQVLQTSNLDLNGVAKNFAKMMRRLIGEDVELKMTLAPGLPQIKADPSMMEQILLNLAVNARDAMPEGGVLTIETGVVNLDQTYAASRFDVTAGDYVMLAVTDTGHGMDEQTRAMIFEPFFTTKGVGKGTGLGLSTVYGIVKQHGGSIWVYSEPGQGTSFKVYFPLAQQGEAVDKKSAEVAPRPAQGETILVVEDDPTLRQFIGQALTNLGYRVLLAGSPQEAQDMARDRRGAPDLMLTDVIMPGMNGKALYESLAPLCPGMKVVFMSGYTENVIAHRGVLREGVSFIQKPFSLSQLARILGTILAEGGEPAGKVGR